jgi:hypothetical protein
VDTKIRSAQLLGFIGAWKRACKNGLSRNVSVDSLDLQVIMDVGHIRAMQKSLPVTGLGFLVLALATQDVSQVPVGCQ